MADCNDLGKEIAELEERLRQNEELQARAEALIKIEELPPSGKTRLRLRTDAGEEVGLSAEYWAKQGEHDMAEMGTPRVRELVEMGFINQEGPRGSSGRMVNYRQFPQYAVDYTRDEPTPEMIAGLLEVMGFKRANTAKGIELKRPFSESVAMQSLLRLARETGADARAVAENLTRRLRSVDSLPAAVVQTAKARWDSVSQFADVVEEVADAMSTGSVTLELRARLGYAAKWAHFFENLDSRVRRRIGQSLRGLQFAYQGSDFELITPDADWGRLTIQDVMGETLLGQVLEHIEKGDELKLRQIASNARMNNLTRTSINGSRIMSQIALLNTFRRNNMLASPASWLTRNPVSGALVTFYYGMEDLVEGAFRVGALDGLRATAHANRMALDAAQMAWKSGATYLGTGKARMGLDNVMEVSQDIVEKDRQFVNDALNNSFLLLQDPTYWRNTAGLGPLVTLANVFNAAVSKTLGRLGESAGWNGGYLPFFRLLGAGDEVVRSMAFALKVNHESYIRAVQEGRKIFDEAGKPLSRNAEWVARRAEAMAEDATFSGYMTQEDLVKLRRERGMPIGDELPDDELRLMVYNDLKGVPRPDDELGAIGIKRAAQVTFTDTVKDPIIQGLGITRQNALVAWQLPFFKQPVNSLLWTLDRTIVPSVLKAIGKQLDNASPEELAQARAQAVVSTMFLSVGSALIAAGGFVGGGPSDPNDYERWRRINTPYSFNIGGKSIPASRFRFGGIDPIDILGLYADLHMLVQEEGISHGDFQQATTGLAVAVARMLNNKASLLNITTTMNAMTQPERYDMTDVLARQMGGIMPLSGLLGAAARVMREPLASADKRRFITPDEKRALGADPIYAERIAPILEMVQRVAEATARPLPGVNQVIKAPERRDWLMSRIERPFGIPWEAVVPFMPIIQPQDPLYQWLADAGVTTKPRADGLVALPAQGSNVSLTMTNDEEAFYRTRMGSTRANVPARAVLGRDQAIPIDSFVQGRTMPEALRELMRSQPYQRAMAALPDSADRRVNRASLEERKRSELYQPIQDIINYYDKLAIADLVSDEDLVARGFRNRYEAMVKAKSRQLQEAMEARSALGLSRQ